MGRGTSIAAGLLRPLNQDYVPNLSNSWDQFTSPFYDSGSVFTLPYCDLGHGDHVAQRHDQPGHRGMANPYEIFWNGAPQDKTHLLSNAQDTLAMAMFRDGLTDVNVTDPATITKAKDDVAEVVEATNAQFDHVDYTDMPKGQAWLHQSWSGNVGSAFVFLPKGDEALNVSYDWPGRRRGAGQRRQRRDRAPVNREEAGARAPVGQPHHGLRERDDELRDVDRLPDAAEEHHARRAGGQPRARAPVHQEDR